MRAQIFRRVSLAAVGASLVCTLSVVGARAQTNGFGSNGFGTAIHGVPPSVTSFGFGGNPGFHGVPPSVTSNTVLTNMYPATTDRATHVVAIRRKKITARNLDLSRGLRNPRSRRK